MKITSIEKRIKKISRVVEAFKADNEISNLERDLLLGYIRELYDLVLNAESDTLAIAEAKSPSRLDVAAPAAAMIAPPQPTPPSVQKVEVEPIVEKINAKLAEIELEMERNNTIVVETPVKTVAEAPVIHEPVVSEPVVPEPLVQKVEEPVKAQTIAPDPVSTPEATQSLSAEMQELFEEQGGNDLSDRLGRSKIKSLNAVIGINERIFTIQELFGKDGELYKSVVEGLESATSFDEAKTLLIDKVAVSQNWEAADKKNKATHFIKLVRRLYA